MSYKQPSKIRSFLVIGVGAFVVYFLLSFFTGKSAQPDTVKVKMAQPPSISSVPGSVKDNARYKELQEKENEKRANEAKKTGQSALPTLVNKTEPDQNDQEFFKEMRKTPEEEKKPTREDNLKKAQEEADKRLKEQQARLDKIKKEQEDKRKQVEQARADVEKNKQQSKELENLVNGYLTDIANVTKVYGTPSKQSYVAGSNNNVKTAEKNTTPTIAKTPLYKAGSIIYGVIQTDYNSDNGGPILAKITSGPLAGSTLLGTTSVDGDSWATGLNITFSTLSRPLAQHSQAVSLQAIDPETLAPAVESYANYHYGQRYSALLLAGALEQGSNAATSAATSGSSNNASSNTSSGSSSTSSSSSTSGLSSLGTPVADDIVSNLRKVGSRPATYRVERGTPIGLMFTSDFVLES